MVQRNTIQEINQEHSSHNFQGNGRLCKISQLQLYCIVINTSMQPKRPGTLYLAGRLVENLSSRSHLVIQRSSAVGTSVPDASPLHARLLQEGQIDQPPAAHFLLLQRDQEPRPDRSAEAVLRIDIGRHDPPSAFFHRDLGIGQREGG